MPDIEDVNQGLGGLRSIPPGKTDISRNKPNCPLLESKIKAVVRHGELVKPKTPRLYTGKISLVGTSVI